MSMSGRCFVIRCITLSTYLFCRVEMPVSGRGVEYTDSLGKVSVPGEGLRRRRGTDIASGIPRGQRYSTVKRGRHEKGEMEVSLHF